MPFEKGDKNCNKKGRPKNINSLTYLLKQYMLDNNKKDLLIENIYKEALNGNPLCMDLIFKYTDGIPKQRIDSKVKNVLINK